MSSGFLKVILQMAMKPLLSGTLAIIRGNGLILFQTTPSTQDFVISASLTDPLLILCTLQQVMKQRGLPHSTASFVHSSVEGPIPEPVKTRFQNFFGSCKEIGRGSIILTIVWKKGKFLPFHS